MVKFGRALRVPIHWVQIPAGQTDCTTGTQVCNIIPWPVLRPSDFVTESDLCIFVIFVYACLLYLPCKNDMLRVCVHIYIYISVCVFLGAAVSLDPGTTGFWLCLATWQQG